MYLLDTDVLSLTSPVSALSTEGVEAWRDWVRINNDMLYFSAITIMEMRFGLQKLIAKGATARSDRLKKWLFVTETLYQHRIVPISIEIAHQAGVFLHEAVRRGIQPGAEDALIAATARVMDLQLVSRNRKHMDALGIECLDPIQSLPSR